MRDQYKRTHTHVRVRVGNRYPFFNYFPRLSGWFVRCDASAKGDRSLCAIASDPHQRSHVIQHKPRRFVPRAPTTIRSASWSSWEITALLWVLLALPYIHTLRIGSGRTNGCLPVANGGHQWSEIDLCIIKRIHTKSTL